MHSTATHMGQLKPDATYIYERVDDVVYRRESGSLERTEVGRDYDMHAGIQADKLWGEIRRAAKSNPALQEALDCAIIIYQLSKTT
jgi:hypothetical protein